jgi:hypothetical protein
VDQKNALKSLKPGPVLGAFNNLSRFLAIFTFKDERIGRVPLFRPKPPIPP